MEHKAKIRCTDISGNSIPREELARSTGVFNYEIIGIENVSLTAKSLHSEARRYGQTGNFEKAIEKLHLAIKEAPYWPYPPYDLAFTFLLKEDYENALKYYRITDSLAPNGYYTSKTALHTLERERKRELKAGLYKKFLSLEWMIDPDERLRTILSIVTNFPSFAAGWEKYANHLEGKDRINAIEMGLKADADVETKGMLYINKALMLDHTGDNEAAIKMLSEVIFDKKSTYANIEMAKFALHNITQKGE